MNLDNSSVGWNKLSALPLATYILQTIYCQRCESFLRIYQQAVQSLLLRFELTGSHFFVLLITNVLLSLWHTYKQFIHMKKNLLFLVMFFCAINVLAQKTVYVKLLDNRAYYKVEREGKKTQYYFATLQNASDLKSYFEYFGNRIKQQKYEEVHAEEALLDDAINNLQSQNAKENTDKPKLIRIIDDQREIIAKPINRICTSSEYTIGKDYRLLEVDNALEKKLIGCNIMCRIIEKRKSNISGSEGRLIIRPLYIINNDGSKIHLQPTDIVKRGLNLANIKFWLAPLVIPMFIPGTGAAISEGEEFELRIE